MKLAVVIPARYQSSRLPGKPLIHLRGVPMVVRTFRQCAKACPAEMIYVATDDLRVRAACLEHGIRVLLTSPACLTGTDRLAECLDTLDCDTLINVQGDEPVFEPDDLRLLLDAAQSGRGAVLNGFCALASEHQFQDPSVPKVVMRHDRRLLYMSRSPIPVTKHRGFVKGWRQVCAYAFPRDALRDFAARPAKTELESIEDIEILRFLELGWDVQMISMSDRSFAVDLPEHVEAVERLIDARGL